MKDEILCPSACCKPGADLLGIVMGSGEVSFLPVPVKIDDSFVQIALQGRRPEKRFRFAAPCLTDGCEQWSQGRCGVIDRFTAGVAAEIDPLGDVRHCLIRPQCRWFSQNGAAACQVCSQVVTDVSEGIPCPPENPLNSA